MIYSGIGSRQTPDDVLDRMVKIGKSMAQKGLILRSGGAEGADIAFEDGCDMASGKKEIYYANGKGIVIPDNIWEQAMQIAAKTHPAWDRCSAYAKRLHARNGFQILGRDLKTPTDFVVCWTKDGGPTGGTGQAIRLAMQHNIPIYNLYRESALLSLRDLFQTL